MPINKNGDKPASVELAPSAVMPATIDMLKVQTELVQQAAAAAVASTPAPISPSAFAAVAAPLKQEMAIAEANVQQGFEKTVASLKNSTTGALAGFEKTQAEVKSTMEKAMKTAEEFVTIGQGNVEAFVRSSQIWTAGIQDIGKLFAATAQSQVEATMGTFKALSSVKSIKEAFELQSSLVRGNMEKVVAETSKLTDASVKLAEQAIAPLTARVTLVAEKFTQAA